ncbi:LuxR family transcriptional regulatory protein [Yersinia aldovae]|uniref:response regulator transcription factor n=1 Tax=Yersinia aldovae TaxID=29483 RepID=UPI0005DE7D27|nr:LuxR C-terminal-related transcriptional regulator [Yersinia aldovae]CNG96862.1 LuxR family transcriptional regulatory protein [Yersinia aldovae]
MRCVRLFNLKGNPIISVVSLSQSSFFGAGLDHIVSDILPLRKSKHSISISNCTDIYEACDYVETNAVDFLIIDYTWPGENWLNMIIALKERMKYHHFKIISIISEKILEIEHIVIKQTSYLSFDLYNSIQGLLLVLSDGSAIKGRGNNDINMDDILYIYYLRKFKITQREYTILSLILSGNNNKQISLKLDISEKTVSGHRHSIYIKLKVKSVGQLYNKLLNQAVCC